MGARVPLGHRPGPDPVRRCLTRRHRRPSARSSRSACRGPTGRPWSSPAAWGAITLRGTVYDGEGEPVPDALVETWQAPGDGCRGFGRCPTDAQGRWEIVTRKPEAADGEAPHVAVAVFARGLLDRVPTRVYFGDEAEANAADPVLAALDAGATGDARGRAGRRGLHASTSTSKVTMRPSSSDSDGERTRREVLGDEHVDRAQARTTDFTRPFQEFISRYAWGEVWSRPGLDRRQRSMITLAALTAVRAEGELELHVRAALRNGLTPEEISEVLLHTAVYAGVPAANAAFAIAQRVLEEE